MVILAHWFVYFTILYKGICSLSNRSVIYGLVIALYSSNFSS